jgi:single-stranded DNA-specific DHH superfamily exonuclease
VPLEDAIAKARDALRPPVLLVHHDDSDGLCAAAIAKKCLLDQGIEPSMACVEKMFPEVVQNIHDFKGTVVYLDLASGNLDLVEEHCKQATIIIDHHKTREPKDARILVVNPELHGTSGEQCTSSTLAYLFFSRKDQRLAQLAVIGATEIPGDLRGLNRLVMQESGVTISATKSGESYKTMFGKTADSVAKDLTVLGAVVYYQGGPQKALDLCLFGTTRT